MPTRQKYHHAPYLGQDRGGLTVEELMEDEGEVGPNQRQERLAKRIDTKALAMLANAAKREQQLAMRISRKHKGK